jgi:probable HAF family extracellular repeat protein
MRPLYYLSSLGLSGALLAAPSVTAQTYSVKDLGIPPQNNFSEAKGINQSGQVLGLAGTLIPGFTFGQPTAAFVYTDGKMTPLDFSPQGIAGDDSKDSWEQGDKRKLRITGDSNNYAVLYEDHFLRTLGALPGDLSSVGMAVNSSGEVAGVSGGAKAFLYKDGNLFNLGNFPGGSGAQALGINDFGDVTGEAFLASGYGHAFLYRKDKLTDLGTLPGTVYSVGAAINNSVEVTGYAYSADSSLFHAFLWSKGKMLDLGLLPHGFLSQGLSINSWGQVVGMADVPIPNFPEDDLFHGFLYSNGKMYDLNSLIPPNSGWVIEVGQGINDKGEIAATGYPATGNSIPHALLLTLDCKDHRNSDCEPCRNR